MTSRRIALLVSAVIVLGACTSSSSHQDAAPPQDRPNILIVITDDQRATGTLGVMPKTQQLFEQQGRTFTDAFDTTPLCCPSRSSVMTGVYAHNHHVLTNFDSHRLDQKKTIQRYLQDAGYETAITGKYLNHWGASENPPYFDKWSIFLHGEYYNRQMNVQGRVAHIHRYTTSFIEGRAVSYLHDFEHDDSQPWYLYIGTGAPHAPFTPAPRYEAAHVPTRESKPAVHERDRSDKPRYVRRRYTKPRRGRILRRKQLRTLMSVDDLVGRVFDTLTKLDETNDTIAIFVSDNGFFWGEHGLKGKGPPYTQGVQVPLMIRWPGHVDPGTIDDRLASTADIFPTLLAAAGLSPDARYPVDGRSLLVASDRSRLLIEHNAAKATRRIRAGAGVPTWTSDRTSAYQYTEYFRGGRVVGREYFDLTSDPDELHNLLGDRNRGNDPDMRALNRRLAADRACSGSSCP